MEKKLFAEFGEIEALLKNDGLIITTALKPDPKLGGNIYDLLLNQNKYLAHIFNAFFNEKDTDYKNTYLDALRFNNNIELSLSNPFYKQFQNGETRTLTNIIEQVQRDFIWWCEAYVEKQNSHKKIKKIVDDKMSDVYKKATAIYLKAEQDLRVLLPDASIIAEAKRNGVQILGDTKERKIFHDTLRSDNAHLTQHIERVISKAINS